MTYQDDDLDYDQKYYYKAEYVNRYYSSESSAISVITGDKIVDGDVNDDGVYNVSDLVMLQKFLLGNGTLINWKAADLCEDDKIDVFDMVLMRKLILKSMVTE